MPLLVNEEVLPQKYNENYKHLDFRIVGIEESSLFVL